MEPRVQHTRPRDGVSIAYWSIGEGEPLVFMPSMPMSHIEFEWQVPEWRAFYERFAERRRVIRYDGRGIGLSDRRACGLCNDPRRTIERVVHRIERS
jgi:pimeloyl-ACP methyl ester carboxylesterase